MKLNAIDSVLNGRPVKLWFEVHGTSIVVLLVEDSTTMDELYWNQLSPKDQENIIQKIKAHCKMK